MVVLVSGFTIANAQTRPKILVFTRTQGFDHATRVVSDSLIIALGAKNGFDVDTANDTGGYFKPAKLSGYKAVCFVNVTGNIFNDSTKAAFTRYIRAGGGFVGMHACADCEYTWHWYHELVGAYFANHHFGIAPAKLAVLDHANPSTNFLAADTITRSDEWYFFDNQTYDTLIDPAKISGLTVLLNLVESSLPNSTEKKFHPMCWCREFEGGRTWYSGFGHQSSYFRDTIVQKNLLGGILWAAGLTGTKTVNSKPVRIIASNQIPRAVYNIAGRTICSNPFYSGSQYRAAQVWAEKDDFGRKVPAGIYFMAEKKGSTTEFRPIFITK
jgi:type 1 glutamine amidotransferase